MTSTVRNKVENMGDVGLRVIRQDDTEVWQISRPARLNALSLPLAKALSAAAKNLRDQLKSKSKKTPRALLLQAEAVTVKSGDRIWIAGGDLQNLATLNRRDAALYARSMSTLCRFFEQLPLPVIADISGGAIGGGAEFALSADLRLGSEHSFFEFKQMHIGLTTGFGGALRLQSLVGRALSQKYLYSACRIPSGDAFAAGLLTHNTASAVANSTLHTLLQSLMQIDTRVFATQKAMLASPFTKAPQLHRAELDAFTTLWRNPQHERVLAKWQR